MNIDKLLSLTLSSRELPCDELNQKLKMRARERIELMNKRKPIIRAIVIAAVITALASATALAAWLFRTPAEVAESLGFSKMAEAFESDDTITVNQSVECGEYRVTLLGITSGRMLEMMGSEIEAGLTYVVTAVQRIDGSAMPDIDSSEYIPFYACVYIKGVMPWQYDSNLAGCSIISDGIQYLLTSCNTLEPFADRALYLTVSNEVFFSRSAYNYDMETGGITPNEDYEGVNALFVLPLDVSKANPELAAKILNGDVEAVEPPETAPKIVTESADIADSTSAEDTERPRNKLWSELTEEERIARSTYYYTIPLEECELIEDSVKVLELGKDGLYMYKYEDETGSLETRVSPHEFEGTDVVRSGYSGGMYEIWLEVYTKDADGVVRGMLYNAPLWESKE